MNGLNIIEQTGITNSVLVTSHHNNQAVRNLAAQTNTRILPKSLAAEVPIIVTKDIALFPAAKNIHRQVDLVLVNDDKHLVKALTKYLLSNKLVDSYDDPEEFLNKTDNYAKDSKIVIGQEFNYCDMNGLKLLQELHNLGFCNLYLHTEEDFVSESLPSYVKVINKSDTDALEQLSST